MNYACSSSDGRGRRPGGAIHPAAAARRRPRGRLEDRRRRPPDREPGHPVHDHGAQQRSLRCRHGQRRRPDPRRVDLRGLAGTGGVPGHLQRRHRHLDDRQHGAGRDEHAGASRPASTRGTASTLGRFEDEFVVATGDPSPTPPCGRLVRPVDIVRDPSSGQTTTSAASRPNEVLRFSSAGAFVDVIVPAATTVRSARPAWRSTGTDLYVSSYGTHQVLRYDAGTGAALGEFVGPDPAYPYPDGLRRARATSSSTRSGHLYVASSVNSQVRRYAPPALRPRRRRQPRRSERGGAFPTSELSNPHGLAFGPDLTGDGQARAVRQQPQRQPGARVQRAGRPTVAQDRLRRQLRRAHLADRAGVLVREPVPVRVQQLEQRGAGVRRRHRHAALPWVWRLRRPQSARRPRGDPGGDLLVVSTGTNQVLRYGSRPPPPSCASSTARTCPASSRVTVGPDDYVYAAIRERLVGAHPALRRTRGRYSRAGRAGRRPGPAPAACGISGGTVYDIAIKPSGELMFVTASVTCWFGAVRSVLIVLGGPNDTRVPARALHPLVPQQRHDAWLGSTSAPTGTCTSPRTSSARCSSPARDRVLRFDGAIGRTRSARSSRATGSTGLRGIDSAPTATSMSRTARPNSVLRYHGPDAELPDSPGSLIGTFVSTSNPNELGFGPDGNLYVSSDDDVVRRYGPSGDVHRHRIASGLYNPWGLDFSNRGDLFLADIDNNRLLQYAGSAAFEGVFAGVSVQGLNCGRYLALRPGRRSCLSRRRPTCSWPASTATTSSTTTRAAPTSGRYDVDRPRRAARRPLRRRRLDLRVELQQRPDPALLRRHRAVRGHAVRARALRLGRSAGTGGDGLRSERRLSVRRQQPGQPDPALLRP